jgi:RimJ/RimL family protein N-acetyltransferase|tara:strand:- start:871 stop:1299 length:429 start_codon:yes stop_codon:yes gene_type:complete
MSNTGLIFDDKERVGAWVADKVTQSCTWGSFYAMGAEVDGQIVSGVVFNNFNECNATGHIALSKPNKLFLELLDHAFTYAFEACGLRRLTVLVESDNSKSLKFVKRIGFLEEGAMKQAGSAGQDMIVLVLWPENYRKGKNYG